MLTPRENLLSLYKRTGYEYAPVCFALCSSQHEKFIAMTGKSDYFEYYNFPTRYVPMLSFDHNPKVFHQYYNNVKKDTAFDEWGVAYERGSEAAFHMTRMLHPLANADMDTIKNYPWPVYFKDPNKDYKAEVENIHASGLAAVGGFECTIWERAWYIRSMEELMGDIIDGDEKAVYILDKVTELSCQNAIHFAEAGVDILCLGDDIGTQNTILMSVEMYREWLKPRLAKIIKAVKEINPDILVQYHSCGYIEPFIDDLCEAGIDILNPVQPECMDFASIHARYGDRLSFNGTLGTQSTMPFGTPDDVRETVTKNLDIAGTKGGLFCCPSHIIEPEVPMDNITAYIEAAKNYRPRSSI